MRSLYCFGDSFVQWPEPKNAHWTDLFRDEYHVYRMGKNGANNDHIIFQLGNLPKYRDGDRVIIMLTEPARLPKWVWGKHAGVLKSDMPVEAIKNDPALFESLKVTGVFNDLKVLKDKLLHHQTIDVIKNRKHEMDDPKEVLNFIDNIDNLIGEFKPVIVTWSFATHKLLVDKINYLPLESWTSLHQEDYKDRPLKEDYHPGVEGCKMWHKFIKDLLDSSR